MQRETSSDLRPVIRKLVSRNDLSEQEINISMGLILGGKATDAATASFLVALAMKGETSEEINAVVKAVKGCSIQITPTVRNGLVDTCGTGGDTLRSFNISTAAAVIASAAGCNVAKHGNRSVSGFCGSADFFKFIGMDMETSPRKISDTIEHTGLGFLFAPMFHPALRSVSSLRRSIGIRTILNIVGPLSNPCTNLSGQLVGVYDQSLLETIASAMRGTHLDGFMVVHSRDGFDELSNTCENDILWLVDNQIKRFKLHPKILDLPVTQPERLLVHTAEDSIRDTLQVIYGLANPEKEDIAVLNASAVLVIGKIAKDLTEGVEIARASIKDGGPQRKLSELIQRCGDTSKLKEAERKFLLN